ncbi:MAG: hydantoinase/oxoprolinase family protein, partial [Planctomycetota bacterium]|nr:hydantoinase/oxoprolinase family protein [Planctomycetota bacterium]
MNPKQWSEALVVRVGVDTGGTFTDAISPDGKGGWQVHKSPTTPKEPAQGVFSAIRALVPEGESALELVHGTTHATNALLTGKLGRTLLIVTQGFRDVLAIGRQNRDSLFELEPKGTRPVQPRSLVLEVEERLDASGRVIVPLGLAEINRILRVAKRKKPQGIAICFLHAWKEAAHEIKLGNALKGLGIPIVLSSELSPEQREYERATTTWADAGLRPVVQPALEKLEKELLQKWGKQSRLRVMRSDGGTCSAEAAWKEPVHLALSGPAGGLSAARLLADARGDHSILTLDMGGTSTDVALLPPGESPLREMKVAGLPLLARSLPLHTVGTGGGSLADIDPAGELRVGPLSAGSVPGPACYGNGGRQPTVTDAHLLCGRIHPSLFLDGGNPLDERAANAAFRAVRANPAEVLEIASAEMERALRKVSLAEGHDPRTLSLYAFGGAGALHAAWLADRMGMKEVIVPPFPGAFSAWGLLAAPLRRNFSRAILKEVPAVAQRRELFKPLLKKANQELHSEGLPKRKIKIQKILELRSMGQAAVFAVPEGPHVFKRFHAAHQQRFGYARKSEKVILVSIRVQADGPKPKFLEKKRCRIYSPKVLEKRMAAFPEEGSHRPRKTDWFRREELRHGARISGPAVIAEYSATTIVPPGWRAQVDSWNCLSLKRNTK